MKIQIGREFDKFIHIAFQISNVNWPWKISSGATVTVRLVDQTKQTEWMAAVAQVADDNWNRSIIRAQLTRAQTQAITHTGQGFMVISIHDTAAEILGQVRTVDEDFSQKIVVEQSSV